MSTSYITYAQLAVDVLKLINNIPRSTILNLSAVVGVPRSGMLPATMIGNELHLPVLDCYAFARGGLLHSRGGLRLDMAPLGSGDTVLVIDDSSYKGTALNAVRKLLDTRSVQYNIVYAAVYKSPESDCRIDYFAREVPAPRYFEWNIIQHQDTMNMMFDLDGVLCHDPDHFDDDGILYEHAIATTKVLHAPRRTIGAICTMRLERWREVTERWLHLNFITYSKLHMHPAKTAEERRRMSPRYGEYKAGVYRESACSLFVESSHGQAEEIAAYSGRPCLCLSTGTLFQ